MSKASRLAACAALLLLNTCGVKGQMDDAFGDQNFKSAIALVELHRVRFGAYPDKISDLKFLGQWDQIYVSGVEYRKLDEGYELNVTRGWVGKPTLEYPAEFWQGIGLRKSNMLRASAPTPAP